MRSAAKITDLGSNTHRISRLVLSALNQNSADLEILTVNRP